MSLEVCVTVFALSSSKNAIAGLWSIENHLVILIVQNKKEGNK